MAYSECLPTLLNPVAERTCFFQVLQEKSWHSRLARLVPTNGFSDMVPCVPGLLAKGDSGAFALHSHGIS